MNERRHASGRTYFIVVRDGAIIQCGIYVDRYRLVDGEWKISYRQVRMELDLLAGQYAPRQE